MLVVGHGKRDNIICTYVMQKTGINNKVMYGDFLLFPPTLSSIWKYLRHFITVYALQGNDVF